MPTRRTTESLVVRGNFVGQDSHSRKRFGHVDDTAGETCVPDMNTLTEDKDICEKGTDAAARYTNICSNFVKTRRVGGRKRPRAAVYQKRHNESIAGSSITGNITVGENKAKGIDNVGDSTNNSVVFISDSGSTSPCTPSSDPSADPSPSFCLPQPVPAMLVGSGDQAALPPPVANCCLEGQRSNNVKDEDAAGGRVSEEDTEPSLLYKGQGEEEPSGRCTDDGEKKREHESNAADDAEQAISRWVMYEKSAETENRSSSATSFPAADSSSGISSAGSRSLEEPLSKTDQAWTSVTGATDSMKSAYQPTKHESPVLHSSTSCEPTRPRTAAYEVTPTESQEAGRLAARDSRMQGKALSDAANDTSDTQRSGQTDHAEDGKVYRSVHTTGGSAAASKPPSLSRREEMSTGSTAMAGTTTTEQVKGSQVCMQQLHEESGESNGFTGATCFLQKLQQREADADSRCNALLSQLSIPLPAREKLLQNSAPLVKKSRREELTDSSSFLSSGEEACSKSPSPLLPSSAPVVTPGTSSAGSSNNGIKHAALQTATVSAGRDREASVPVNLLECRRLCGYDSSLPGTYRSTAPSKLMAGRRGAQQQQQIERYTREQQLMETLLKGDLDRSGGGTDVGITQECHHDIPANRLLPPATAVRGHTKDVRTKTCRGRGNSLADVDLPAAEASNDFVAAAVAAAAAQVLQHQLRHQEQDQQQHASCDLQEASMRQAHPGERQRYIRASENWTRCDAAAALDDVLGQSSNMAGDGHRAADEESVNIRRWFESFGIAGRRAETAVAAVVKRAVDLQRRLATLLTVTLRQQLNQRLLVLALAILLEKHRREPVRCEEMLREQQRLLRVLETQQQQALADLPHLYGDLPEAQQLQQQLQQLREAEWQLRTGGDCFAVAQENTEEHACHHRSRDSDLCLMSSTHTHCLPHNSMCRVRTPPAAAAAAIEGTARMFYPSGRLVPCTRAVSPERNSARWTVCMHYQAEKKGRLVDGDNPSDMLVLSTATGTPAGGVLSATGGDARPAALPQTDHLQSLTNGTTAEAAVMLSGNSESCIASSTVAAELLTAGRHSRHRNSSLIREKDSEAPSGEKQWLLGNEGSELLQTQQPMVERFLVKQIARCFAANTNNTQDATSASNVPASSNPSTSGGLELATAATGTTKESWRSDKSTSNSGACEDKEVVTARGKSARNISAATITSPARLCTGNAHARSDASPERNERDVTVRPAAASEASKSLPSAAGRQNASPASTVRGAAAGSSVEAHSPRPVKTAEDGTVAAPGIDVSGTLTAGAGGQGIKGLTLPATRTHAAALQTSPLESNVSNSNNVTSGAGSDVSSSGNFTSVYSRGSNARHQNDPYPHHVMIQLIQPLPTGIKLELKSHRPASLGNAQGSGAVSGSSSSITSLSCSSVDMPAPREYALRVSLTRHETKYCSFHSLHGILPAYNEAVRLRNKFAGLPFVLPTMTLEELHQRKEQLDAGRPLPGHGPHEAFMTVQERITYYKQTGISTTNYTKTENASGSASSSSVFCSPRSASPTSSAVPAGGRSSQSVSPIASGSSGNSSACKARSFRSSSTSSPSGVADIGAGATPAELDGDHRGRSSGRGANGDEHQHRDQMRCNVGRGGGTSEGKRGRTLSPLSSGQQESQTSWPSKAPLSVTQQHSDDYASSKHTNVCKLAARTGKPLASMRCRPVDEGYHPAALHEKKMHLRSRTTSSSGSRSDGTTISSATETESVKESSGAAEYRIRGEKRRKISNDADDIQLFLQSSCHKSSNSEPDEGLSSSRISDPGAYTLRSDDPSVAEAHSPGADAGSRQASSTAGDGRKCDYKQSSKKNEGSGRGSGGKGGTACHPWGDLYSWDTPLSPLCTKQSTADTAVVGSECIVNSSSATTEDLELLAQELRTGDQLRALLDKEFLGHPCEKSKPSPRPPPVAHMLSGRQSQDENDWLPLLHARDGGSADEHANGGALDAANNRKHTKFRGPETRPSGLSSSPNRELIAAETSGLLEAPRSDVRREGATADHEGDNCSSRAPPRNSGRRYSSGAPAQKAGNVEKHMQESISAEDLQVVMNHQVGGARPAGRCTGSTSKILEDEKCDAGEQELDVNEEEARHLSELLFETGMFGDVRKSSDDAEGKRVAREVIPKSDGEVTTADAAAVSTVPQLAAVSTVPQPAAVSQRMA